MSNYTTQTAALKAVTIDTTTIDAKRIDTKKLFVNGVSIDELQGGGSSGVESPNQAFFSFMFHPIDDEYDVGYFSFSSFEDTTYEDEDYGTQSETLFDEGGYLIKGSETDGAIENGIYAIIILNENFQKCISSIMEDFECFTNVLNASFSLLIIDDGITAKIEPTLLEHSLIVSDGEVGWCIKICEEDDNLSELYGGIKNEPYFSFIVSIPYYNPSHIT